jgi:transposase
VKVARKLAEQVGPLEVSGRTMRRYVQAIKQTVATRQRRYYEPVLDHVPGVQCQVDPGERRGVWIGGAEQSVYFVVFVLSYSRLMYVGVSFAPLDTERFIRLHDEAFRYFGGLVQECVYDQTKMVVIEEVFRELTLSSRFHEYATTAGFRVHACQGYDPESKGKVEAGVKYVKQDCLYGESFADRDGLRRHVQAWLDTVANRRVHGTTGRLPWEHFETEEKAHLRPYLTPRCVQPGASGERRQADKTGLISWQANKYSVPMAYQSAAVGVSVAEDQLRIYDLESAELIATPPLSTEKGRIFKNTHHYRDHQQRLQDLEQGLRTRLGEVVGERLCAVLKTTSPRIYQEQLVAVARLLDQQEVIARELMARLAARSELTATTLKRYLEAEQRARERGRTEPSVALAGNGLEGAVLRPYALLGSPGGRSSGQEVKP